MEVRAHEPRRGRASQSCRWQFLIPRTPARRTSISHSFGFFAFFLPRTPSHFPLASNPASDKWPRTRLLVGGNCFSLLFATAWRDLTPFQGASTCIVCAHSLLRTKREEVLLHCVAPTAPAKRLALYFLDCISTGSACSADEQKQRRGKTPRQLSAKSRSG